MPTYDLPIGFTIEAIHLSGNSSIARIGDSTYSFTAGALSGTFTVTETQIIFPADTDPAMLTLIQAQLAKVGQPPEWDGPAQNLFTLAQSAVGVAIQDLTTPQVKALLVLVLWDKKAIDNNLKVKPLGGWVKRRPK